jgi:SSS family solute:Na+ symporter
MVWLNKLFMATLLVLISSYALGAGSDERTTVDWRPSEQLSGVGDSAWPGVAGSFVGVHNGALILAGGLGERYHDEIWIATRASAAAVTWHDTELTLPNGRAFGASTSHPLGVFAIGGSNGDSGSKEVLLISWSAELSATTLLKLPPLPGGSMNGGAATVGDILYVSAGDLGSEIYAFDLSRIETNASGHPMADGTAVRLGENIVGQGGPTSFWQQLPALSRDNTGERQAVTLVTQNNGRGDQLFAIVGRGGSAELWAYDPAAAKNAAQWAQETSAIIDGQNVDFAGAAAIDLGQSHILLLTGLDQQGVRQALSYNTITGVWARYNDAPATALATDASTHAIHWMGDIVLVGGSTSAVDAAQSFWTIDVNGPELTFGWVNMSVLVVYLFSMVMVGVYFVFKNNSTDDYFRGGQNIPWWAAACSIYATMLSSLTYVALPALVYRTDWVIYIGVMMILVVAPVAIYVAMPFFRQIDATSAYEYLSKRFNMPVRLFASGLFTLFHIGRMGIVLALTALALAAVTPLDAWQSVLVMGVLSLIYCTLGGVEAVIWTDTIQTVVLMIGAVICFTIIVGGVDGGMAGFIDAGLSDKKFNMVNLDFGPGSITTLSIWVIVLGGIGQNISSYTADQAVVQRYMTTKDTKAAAKSIWANGILAVPGALLFFGIGTGLYAFYRSQPEKLDPTIQIDQIFPTFIGAELPVGIAGLIVAGIFAAAQSTVSTSMNSIATTIVTDFMRPFNACRSEKAYLNAARVLTFTMGVIGTLVGLLFISPEIRSLMEEYFKVIGMFMGALGGLFVLGVTTERANGWGALTGILVGVAVMVTVWLMKWADGYLFATIGILTSLVVGYLASFVLPSDKHDISGLTLYTMRDR